MLFAAVVLATLLAGAAGAEDYAAVFGEKYAEAEQYLRENPWISKALQLRPAESRIALAVVFPELIRFSALEDVIQVGGLKVLYVQYGRSYANFSIGRFQMKPSFAEQLESDYERLARPGEKAALGITGFARGDTTELRNLRVLRLDDMAWQVRYLRIFMLVMEKRYGRMSFSGPEDRLRFYATAYNVGYASGEAALRRAINQRRFHTELIFPKATFCYADVALFFFRREAGADGSLR